MASLAMASSISMSLVAPSLGAASLSFSSSSSLRVASSTNAIAPLRLSRGARVVAMAQPKPDISEEIERMVKSATECGDPSKEECRVEWDNVEELSAARAHQRAAAKKKSDPLEVFCEENPETDECRTYED